MAIDLTQAKGVYAIAPTAFHEDGRVDEAHGFSLRPIAVQIFCRFELEQRFLVLWPVVD